MFGINIVFTLKILGLLKLFPNNEKERIWQNLKKLEQVGKCQKEC